MAAQEHHFLSHFISFTKRRFFSQGQSSGEIDPDPDLRRPADDK
jgi:hypothetical protein